MPDNPTPEMLKKMKMDSSSFPVPAAPAASDPSNGTPSKRQSRVATVEDDDVEMENERDLDFAPGGDADYFVEEDEEGRFFGGGLSKDQKEILNIFDKDAEDGVREDVSWSMTLTLDATLSPTVRRTEHHISEKATTTI